jgi:hypothetical protein
MLNKSVVFICLFIVGLAFSQRKEKAVNLVFFDKKFPQKCSICDAKTDAQKKDNALIVSFIESVKCKTCPEIRLRDYIQSMVLFADSSKNLTSFGRAQVYYRIASDLMKTGEAIEGRIYNSWAYLSDFEGDIEISDLPLDQVLAGALQIQEFLAKAASFTDDQGKDFLKQLWLKYCYESGLMERIRSAAQEDALVLGKISKDDWFILPRIDQLDGFVAEHQDLKTMQKSKDIIQTVFRDYNLTGFNPNQGHALITPSFNYSLGNTERIGGELAFERAMLRNPYKLRNRTLDNQIYARVSIFFGYNQEVRNSATREFYFGSGRISQAHFFYGNLFQFGWKNGIDPTKNARWFYRPEVGLAYGNFQMFYSYTLMFNKDMRSLVDRHAINMRFTLPYLRVSHYD